MNEGKRIFLLRKFDLKNIRERFEEIGVHPAGIRIMSSKFSLFVFYLTGLTSPECNILKQEALACGAEAAVPMRAVECKSRKCNVLLSGTGKELSLLSKKLKSEPFFLKEIGKEIEKILNEQKRPLFRIAGNRVLKCDDRPLIMGILNITPDSFSDGGKYFSADDAIRHGIELSEKGADIIDVGGESTRPGSTGIDAREEIKRVIPVIKALERRIKTPISIDTTKSEVAKAALDNGASIINDISGLGFDPKIAKIAGKSGCGLILMHIRGRPRDMQKGEIYYKNVITEITDYLEKSIHTALNAGVNFENIAVDPGIGFGKRPEHNIRIIQDLLAFRSLKRPVLIGVSRKSLLGFITGKEIPEREDATTAIHTILTMSGADILRVHNVKATMDAIKVARAL